MNTNNELFTQNETLLFDDEDEDEKNCCLEGGRENSTSSQRNSLSSSIHVTRQWMRTNPPPSSTITINEDNKETSSTFDVHQKQQTPSPSISKSQTNIQKETKTIVGDDSNEKKDCCCCPQHQYLLTTLHQLQEENKKLKMKLEELENPTPKTIVKMISSNEKYPMMWMSDLRSYEEKQHLLDISVQSCEPNTILTVLLFLRKTLAFPLFVKLIKTIPTVTKIYANYLNKNHLWDELILFYNELGQQKEALMIMLKQAYSLSEPLKQLESLKKCQIFLEKQQQQQQQQALWKWYHEQIRDHMELLAKQIKIENMDSVSTKRNPMFLKFPRESIIFKPISKTLFYCMLYHWKSSDEVPYSPQSLQRTFGITKKRFVYTELVVKSKLKDWEKIKEMVICRGVFSDSIQSPIGLIPFVEVTVKSGGPSELIEFFVSSISDIDERLDVCIKYGLWSLSVQTAIMTRDRTKVVTLQNILTKKLGPSGSSLFVFKLTNALNDPKYYWKK